MSDSVPTTLRSRIRRWFFVALGIPTFLMPLLVATTLLLMPLKTNWRDPSLRQLVDINMSAVLGAVPVMMAIYVIWASVARGLTWGQRIISVLGIVMGNAIAMPIFFEYMMRREAISHAEGASPERLPRVIESAVANLTVQQQLLVRSYFREYHWPKWLGVLLLYCGILMAVSELCFHSQILGVIAASFSSQPVKDFNAYSFMMAFLHGANAALAFGLGIHLLAWNRAERATVIALLEAANPEPPPVHPAEKTPVRL